MYSVATLSFGRGAHLGFMEPLGRFMFWVAVAAWIAVALAFLKSAGSGRRDSPPGRPT